MAALAASGLEHIPVDPGDPGIRWWGLVGLRSARNPDRPPITVTAHHPDDHLHDVSVQVGGMSARLDEGPPASGPRTTG